jgi:hypothetical protein
MVAALYTSVHHSRSRVERRILTPSWYQEKPIKERHEFKDWYQSNNRAVEEYAYIE